MIQQRPDKLQVFLRMGPEHPGFSSQPKHDRPAHIQRHIEGHGWVLWQISDNIPALTGIFWGEIPHANLSACWPKQSQQQPQKRGLSSAVRPDHPHHRSGFHLKIYLLKHKLLPVGKVQSTDIHKRNHDARIADGWHRFQRA